MLTIDVVSDVICPWCYLGKKRLEKALSLVPELETQVRWHPFLLDPGLPPEGKDRKQYMEEKFPDTERIHQVHLHLTEAGKEVGLAYNFDAITRTPNTLDAHRLIAWAGPAGKQNEMVEELFRRYWVEGQDISDHHVLTEAAMAVGMDGHAIHHQLHHDDSIDFVMGSVEHARQIGVEGVPTFIIAGQYGISGAQDPETLAKALKDIAEKQG